MGSCWRAVNRSGALEAFGNVNKEMASMQLALRWRQSRAGPCRLDRVKVLVEMALKVTVKLVGTVSLPEVI